MVVQAKRHKSRVLSIYGQGQRTLSLYHFPVVSARHKTTVESGRQHPGHRISQLWKWQIFKVAWCWRLRKSSSTGMVQNLIQSLMFLLLYSTFVVLFIALSDNNWSLERPKSRPTCGVFTFFMFVPKFKIPSSSGPTSSSRTIPSCSIIWATLSIGQFLLSPSFTSTNFPWSKLTAPNAPGLPKWMKAWPSIVRLWSRTANVMPFDRY